MKNSQHLVLIVGTNPIPNYVVAQYLIKKSTRLEHIWFVHSEEKDEQQGTKHVAENIVNVLKRKNAESTIKFHYISLENVSSASTIVTNIKEQLIHRLNDGQVHLNYTGGTKAMAVHVYRTLKLALKDRSTFSYLDSRKFTLRLDSGAMVSANLRKEISLSFTDLIDLNGFKKNAVIETKSFPRALDEFETLIRNHRLKEDYLIWSDNFIRSVYYERGRFITQKNRFLKRNGLDEDLQTLDRWFKQETSSATINILKQIPIESSPINEDGSIWIPCTTDTNKTFEQRLKYSIRGFLDGKWLESYVSRILNDFLQKDATLSHVQLEENWEIQINGNSKPFELDVITMNGYQLCGVSITSSASAHICKAKGFEIIHRTRQLGGDEAKAVLITCLPQSHVDLFTEDLLTISGANKEKLLVLGEYDLKPERLWMKLKHYIWEY